MEHRGCAAHIRSCCIESAFLSVPNCPVVLSGKRAVCGRLRWDWIRLVGKDLQDDAPLADRWGRSQ
jgi:hypothetical protein